MTDTPTTPFDRVLALLRDRGISEGAACLAAGLDRSALSKARKNDGSLSLQSITALATALDVPVSALLGEEAVAAAPGSRLATAAYAEIVRNPHNPRRHFEADALREMAVSVAEKGVLSPLLVRPRPDGGAGYELIAGERRWRGVGLAIEALSLAADYPIPVIVHPCDDREALQIAMVENLQRRDMTALEEAEGYAAMVEMGDTPADIERRLGVNRRTIQKRLRILAGTTPQVRAALEDGTLSVEQANVLAAYCPKSKQNATIDEIKRGHFATTKQLKHGILETHIPASAALFDPAAYTGEWIEDEDQPGERYFADAARFRALQDKAIKAKTAELEGKYPWVKIIDRSKFEHFYSWEYDQRPKHKLAGAVMIIDANRAVTLHLDMVRNSDLEAERKAAARAATATPDAPVEPTTKAHNSHAHRRKTAALQNALAAAPMMAVRAACLALMKHAYAVRITPDAAPVIDDAGFPRAVIEAELPALSEACGKKLSIDDCGVGCERAWERGDAVGLWRALVAMPDERIMALFAALIALRTGSFDGYAPELGDQPSVVAMADSLGLVGHEHEVGLTLQIGDLDGLRKSTLLDIADAVGLDGRDGDKTVGGLKERINAAAWGNYVLPSLRFGSAQAIEAMLKGESSDTMERAAQ